MGFRLVAISKLCFDVNETFRLAFPLDGLPGKIFHMLGPDVYLSKAIFE